MKKETKERKFLPIKLILPVVGVAVVLMAFVFFWPRKRTFSSLSGKREYNVVLVTVDTLRADRIHCYGFPNVETPYMDLLASRGVKFNQCIAETPLTLPSHTSLMTGTYPTFHGVRDNGGFLVPPQLTTLAESFKQKGYKTAAFVAAYSLDSKWGLNQGFDYYFDKFDLSKYKNISLGNVQRRGDEVIDEVLKWFEGNRSEKFFIWIHLFDPHTPYEPPSPYKERYPDSPYIGEIAFADSQMGRLWSYLEENNLIDKTFFVFAADHGESLDEHQESTHGFFVYQEGIHVPLIFVTPFKKLQGISRENVVSLVDVMPTVLQMANLQVPAQVQGMSLLPLFFKETELERDFAYSETFYPRFHYGWSELKTIQEKRYKLIIAPELELYDLTDDPDEQKNLVLVRPEETRRLIRKAEQFIEESSHGAFELDYRNLDEEARQKLAALGYIGSFMDSASLKGRRLSDPKEKIGVFNRLSRAKEMGLEGDVEEALRMVNEIINEDPEVIDAYFTMGNLYFKEHRFKEALESFFKVLDKKPGDAFTVINIANSYVALGNFDEAEKFLSSVIDSLPPDSQIYFILGNIKNIKEEYPEAIRYYQECIKLNPASASAYSELGGIYVIQKNFSEAEKFLENARELNSSLRNLHYYLAQIYEERGDLIQAADEYREELENNPSNFRACFNLSRIYRLRGDSPNEEVYLLKTIELNPDYPYSYFYLARIYLNQGEKYAEAISLVKRGIEAKPLEKYLPVGYFLLADLYYRLGQESKSREYTRKGRESVQNNSHQHNSP